MINLWVRMVQDMQHAALVAMWMPCVDSTSFMSWRPPSDGFPAIAGC